MKSDMDEFADHIYQFGVLRGMWLFFMGTETSWGWFANTIPGLKRLLRRLEK